MKSFAVGPWLSLPQDFTAMFEKFSKNNLSKCNVQVKTLEKNRGAERLVNMTTRTSLSKKHQGFISLTAELVHFIPMV